jgi:glycosyltransferase involved in cell wall biosynthesis
MVGVGQIDTHSGLHHAVTKTVLIVPCFNEEHRLDSKGFVLFASQDVELLFVDDGSTDGTRAILESLCQQLHVHGVPAQTLPLNRNCGKGEAVRRGMLRALDSGASTVGYFDADLATPPSEAVRLIATLDARSADAVLGARVLLLGSCITRRPVRHYLGRIFATAASLLLRMPVYDTQCGAKVFRRTAALESALSQPFSARWAFDVELIGRLHVGTANVPGLAISRFVEMPLGEWRDVSGSTLRPTAFPLLGLELVRILWALRRWRAQ